MAKPRSPSDEDPKSQRDVALAGSFKFSNVRGDVNEIIGGARSVISTGSGAYTRGGVNTGGGAFVGRDNTLIVQRLQAGRDELRAHLTTLERLLYRANLEPDVVDIVLADLKTILQQMGRETPNGAVVKAKLSGLVQLLNNTDIRNDIQKELLGAAGAADRVAQALFL